LGADDPPRSAPGGRLPPGGHRVRRAAGGGAAGRPERPVRPVALPRAETASAGAQENAVPGDRRTRGEGDGPMTALLELSGVSKHFGGMKAVDDVSFTVRQGTVCGLIGPDGAGKTTVVNLISGYLKPTAETVLLAGQDVATLRPHRLAAAGVA